MIREVLKHYHLPLLTSFGMLLFLAVFAGALYWVYRKDRKEGYEALGMIPLDDETLNLKHRG